MVMLSPEITQDCPLVVVAKLPKSVAPVKVESFVASVWSMSADTLLLTSVVTMSPPSPPPATGETVWY